MVSNGHRRLSYHAGNFGKKDSIRLNPLANGLPGVACMLPLHTQSYNARDKPTGLASTDYHWFMCTLMLYTMRMVGHSKIADAEAPTVIPAWQNVRSQRRPFGHPEHDSAQLPADAESLARMLKSGERTRRRALPSFETNPARRLPRVQKP